MIKRAPALKTAATLGGFSLWFGLVIALPDPYWWILGAAPMLATVVWAIYSVFDLEN